jgi:signal transduction histidine kinase
VRDGLAGDVTGSIYQDAEGTIWVGSSSGLSRFKDGRFTVFTTKDGLPDNRIVTIARTAGNTTWVLTPRGLVRVAGNRFVARADIGGVRLESVTTILEDRSGALWLGTGEDGVTRLRDGHAIRYTRREGLADDTVLSLFEDRAGNVWIGTLRGGVTRVDEQGHLTSWSTHDGLASDHVKAFFEDRAGALWIGGGGLSRFKNGRVTPISSRQGLYNDTVFQILEDEGNLWMNCNVGVSRASLKELNDVADGRAPTLTSFAYGTADGMLSSEGVGAQPAGWKMRDGTLWFPTTRGVVVVDPRRRDMQPPRVVIESVAVDGRFARLDQTARLSPRQENLEIQYTGLSWNRPQAIRFKFRLQGLDSHWIEAGTRRTAYYSHVPPGAYTFTVIADNGDGVWNTTGRSFSLVVLPPFYRTWWFVSLVAAALITTIAVAHRFRIRQLTERQIAQETFARRLISSQEQERKRIAGEIHDSLGQSLAIIKNRALLGIHTAADLDAARDQFTRIAAQSTQAIDEAREISFNLRPYLLDRLGLTKALESMVHKVADGSAVRFSVDITELDGFFTPDEQINVYRIVQECLNNIVKHAGASGAAVRVIREGNTAVMTISDNGHGFAHERDAAAEGRSGFGLIGIHERARLLGATPAIESSPDHGTRITVRFMRRAGGRPPPDG